MGWRGQDGTWVVSHLHSDAGLAAEHHLQTPDVALGAVRDVDLAGGDAGGAVEGVCDCLPQWGCPLLCTVPAQTIAVSLRLLDDGMLGMNSRNVPFGTAGDSFTV